MPSRFRSRRARGMPRSFVIPEKMSDARARERLRLPVIANAGELSINHADRPRTRGDCADGLRPCPWVSCKHHLYLDVTEAGGLKVNFPGVEPWEMSPSCALDVADRGGITLELVGEYTNTTRERMRQVEVRGLLKLVDAARQRHISREDVGDLGRGEELGETPLIDEGEAA